MTYDENQDEDKWEFEYYLSDRETVVDFNAPTETLYEYLKSTSDSISSIRVKILRIKELFSQEEPLEEDLSRYRNLKTALSIQLSLQSKLWGEILLRKKSHDQQVEELKLKHERQIEGLKLKHERQMEAYRTECESKFSKYERKISKLNERMDELQLAVNKRKEVIKHLTKRFEEQSKAKRELVARINDFEHEENEIISKLLEMSNVSLTGVRDAVRFFKAARSILPREVRIQIFEAANQEELTAINPGVDYENEDEADVETDENFYD